jgi:hypothetical protein
MKKMKKSTLGLAFIELNDFCKKKKDEVKEATEASWQ